jgi:hypothetical protein
MPSFDVDGERINVFELDEFYVFKHFFEMDDAFNAVRDYYNGEEYRFEVPKDELSEVKDRLADYFYELEVVDDIKEFCVARRKYSDHPKLLFRNAVDVRSRGEYKIFVMKDELGVEQALMHEPQRLMESDLEIEV